MFTITKEWRFDSAHFLPHVPPGHKCGKMHGHTYRLILQIETDELQDGMVVEYGELSAIVRPLVDADHRNDLNDNADDDMPCLDHTVLNNIPGLGNPTTEVLSQWIYDHLEPLIAKTNGALAAVTVHESSTTSCTYRPSPPDEYLP